MHAFTAIDHESPTTTDIPTTSTTNEPTTTIVESESPMTENTTTEGAKDTSSMDGQQSSIINAIESVPCSQSTATGLITGVAVGGVLIGALITLLAALIIVIILRLTKKNKNELTLFALNRITQGMNENEEKMKDIDTKIVEEPVYSVVLPNPTARGDQQMNMNANECYSTTRMH